MRTKMIKDNCSNWSNCVSDITQIQALAGRGSARTDISPCSRVVQDNPIWEKSKGMRKRSNAVYRGSYEGSSAQYTV